MIAELLTCAVCGVSYLKHHHTDHHFVVRDDQATDRTDRPGHYALEQHRVVPLVNPAAGVDAVWTVPAASRWEVLAARAKLTTSATVANRIPHLVLTDDLGNTFYDYPSNNNQVAGTVLSYGIGIGIVAANFDNTITLVLAVTARLNQKWTIGFSTTGLQAGDQWSACALMVHEWLSF
jgi:hypothetical protein